jgi:iron(III) transport system substrate-binding protein
MQREGSLMRTRREFLKSALGVSSALLLVACNAPQASAPTSGASAPTTAAAAKAAAPASSGPDEAALYAAAQKEGSVVWWTAHYAQSAAEVVRDAFVAKYPGVQVDFIRQTAQVVFERVSQSLKAGAHDVDVFASTDESHYPALKSQKALATYTPLGVDQLPEAFRNIDPDGTYHVGALGFVVINYAPPTVATPPKKWSDLLDPQWKDKLTVGHPGFSGFVGNWVVAMNDRYGWEYFTKLAANNPKIGRSINDTVTDIVGKERQVGAGPDNFSLEKKAAGNPIDVQFPDDDAILIASPVAILKDAPHPNAARLFESFFYSKEYSLAMAKTFNYPLRSDVPAPSGRPLDQVKWYRNKVDRLATGIPEVIDKWRETFGV